MVSMRPPRNIPIEILRTAVAIGDAGTFTKAASRLAISQPAVSSQVKRLQQIIGGDIFERGVGRVVPTKLGDSVLLLARRTIENHDQILRLSAAAIGPERIRLGLSSLLVREFMRAQSSPTELSNIFIRTEFSDDLARELLSDRLDVACCMSVDTLHVDLEPFVVAEREDELIWIRSSNFVVSPGQPIPIVTWRGESWMTAALARDGLSYQVVFDGVDFNAKRSAIEAGQGISALPARLLPRSLVRAQEYYLPELPKVRTTLYARSAQRTDMQTVLLERLRSLFIDIPDQNLPQRKSGLAG